MPEAHSYTNNVVLEVDFASATRVMNQLIAHLECHRSWTTHVRACVCQCAYRHAYAVIYDELTHFVQFDFQ